MADRRFENVVHAAERACQQLGCELVDVEDDDGLALIDIRIMVNDKLRDMTIAMRWTDLDGSEPIDLIAEVIVDAIHHTISTSPTALLARIMNELRKQMMSANRLEVRPGWWIDNPPQDNWRWQ